MGSALFDGWHKSRVELLGANREVRLSAKGFGFAVAKQPCCIIIGALQIVIPQPIHIRNVNLPAFNGNQPFVRKLMQDAREVFLRQVEP